MKNALLRSLVFGLALVGACATFSDERLRQDINLLLIDTVEYLPIRPVNVHDLQWLEPGRQVAVVSRPDATGYRTIQRGSFVEVVAGRPPDTTLIMRRNVLIAQHDQMPAASIHKALGISAPTDAVLLGAAIRISPQGRREVDIPLWTQDVVVEVRDPEHYMDQGADALVVIGVLIGIGILIAGLIAVSSTDSWFFSNAGESGCFAFFLILLGVGALLALMLGLMMTG